MVQTWDMSRLRKVAGLGADSQSAKTLNEGSAFDRNDDEDEDRDARIAFGDKRQASFEKRNSKELTAAQKEANDMKAKKAAAAAKAKAAQKAEADAKPKEEPKVEPKAEEPAAVEAKRRGKVPNESSFNQQAMKYAKEHQRASFIRWAFETHGKGKNYASALFAKYNPKSSREVKESASLWIITHPQLSTYTLAENYEMNQQLTWVDSTSNFNTLTFTTEAEATKVLKHIQEWKNWHGNVEQIVFDDAE